MTYESLLRLANKKAREHHKEEEAAKLLLMELSKQTASEFFLNFKKNVDETLQKKYLDALDQYLIHNIPVQHLIGHSYFFGYAFKVNEDVLIPRAETEQLVGHVLYYIDTYFPNQKVNLLDLGTGSGCIGLTLALEEKSLHVTISDISEKALKIASFNNENLHAEATVIQSDLFDSIEEKFDVIVSNPPYIPDSEIVEDIVQKEPSVALYGGTLGVDFYDRILEQAKSHIHEKAMIAFEHGYQQKEVIYGFARKHFPTGTIIQMKDLAGKDRFTLIGIGGVLL
ncbi:MAG: protein-(glutamine-N5) methyltransferase, release factor-specific [Tenericutes bacterium GWF2_38_8]|nr:MAG: protein-(glutamine-N5) methyltransferase, release factor-specific [Tenericutes bacterium GWF2_38_8]